VAALTGDPAASPQWPPKPAAANALNSLHPAVGIQPAEKRSPSTRTCPWRFGPLTGVFSEAMKSIDFVRKLNSAAKAVNQQKSGSDVETCNRA
jgi:hypothetical protein